MKQFVRVLRTKKFHYRRRQFIFNYATQNERVKPFEQWERICGWGGRRRARARMSVRHMLVYITDLQQEVLFLSCSAQSAAPIKAQSENKFLSHYASTPKEFPVILESGLSCSPLFDCESALDLARNCIRATSDCNSKPAKAHQSSPHQWRQLAHKCTSLSVYVHSHKPKESGSQSLRAFRKLFSSRRTRKISFFAPFSPPTMERRSQFNRESRRVCMLEESESEWKSQKSFPNENALCVKLPQVGKGFEFTEILKDSSAASVYTLERFGLKLKKSA
jgi:hypothetical protein